MIGSVSHLALTPSHLYLVLHVCRQSNVLPKTVLSCGCAAHQVYCEWESAG
jgi:hypothetical protein